MCLPLTGSNPKNCSERLWNLSGEDLAGRSQTLGPGIIHFSCCCEVQSIDCGGGGTGGAGRTRDGSASAVRKQRENAGAQVTSPPWLGLSGVTAVDTPGGVFLW